MYIVSSMTVHDIPGMQNDGRLASCTGAHANCLSSFEDTLQLPFSFSAQPLTARKNLIEAISATPNSRIVSDHGVYIHAETNSYLFNVKHDFEFLISEQLVHYRCISRAGMYGLPFAKRKLNEIRHTFEALQNSTSEL